MQGITSTGMSAMRWANIGRAGIEMRLCPDWTEHLRGDFDALARTGARTRGVDAPVPLRGQLDSQMALRRGCRRRQAGRRCRTSCSMRHLSPTAGRVSTGAKSVRSTRENLSDLGFGECQGGRRRARRIDGDGRRSVAPDRSGTGDPALPNPYGFGARDRRPTAPIPPGASGSARGQREPRRHR
jgi:hypothetical protein